MCCTISLGVIFIFEVVCAKTDVAVNQIVFYFVEGSGRLRLREKKLCAIPNDVYDVNLWWYLVVGED